jgi:hypothetical protein
MPALERGWEGSHLGLILDKEATPGQPEGLLESTAQGLGQIAGDLPGYMLSSAPGRVVGGLAGGAIGSIIPGAGTAAGAMIGQQIGGAASSFAGAQALRTFLKDRKEKPEEPITEHLGAVGEDWANIGKEALIGAPLGLAGPLARMAATGVAPKGAVAVALNALEGVRSTDMATRAASVAALDRLPQEAVKAAVKYMKGPATALGKGLETTGRLAGETVALSTLAPALHEGRLPTAEDFIHSAALVTALTGAHISVRALRGLYKESPSEFTALRADLDTIAKLKTEGKTVEADALMENMQERMQQLAGGLKNLTAEERARKKEGLEKGVEAGKKKVAERNTEVVKQVQKLEEQGLKVEPEKKEKKVTPKVEALKEEVPPALKEEKLPEVGTVPDTPLALSEGHVIRRDFEELRPLRDKAEEDWGYGDPRTRDLVRRVESLEQAADYILRTQGAIERLTASLEKATPGTPGWESAKGAVESMHKQIAAFELIGSLVKKGVPWRMNVKEFDKVFTADTPGQKELLEKRGRILEAEHGTTDPAEVLRQLQEETLSPLLGKVKFIQGKTTAELEEGYVKAGQVFTPRYATLAEKGSSWVSPDGKVIVINHKSSTALEVLGTLGHEVKHLIDLERGYRSDRPSMADRETMTPEELAEYDTKIKAYQAGVETIGAAYRASAVRHHKTGNAELDASRQWMIEKAVEFGIEVPPEILKEAGVSPLHEMKQHREWVIDGARRAREERLLEQERVQGGKLEVVRNKKGEAQFLRPKTGEEALPRTEPISEERPPQPGEADEPMLLSHPKDLERDLPDNLAIANAGAQMEMEAKRSKRVQDLLSIEAPFKRLEKDGLPGAAEVGFRMKAAPGIWKLYQELAVKFIYSVGKKVRGSKQDLLRAYLAVENPKLLKNMTPEDRVRLEPAVKEIAAYYDAARAEYTKYGVDLDYIKRRMSDATRDFISALDAAGRTTDPTKQASALKQAERRLGDLEVLMESNYVHLPYRMLWKAVHNATPKQRAALRLLHAKKRYTLRLADLFNLRDSEGKTVFKPEDFSVAEAFGSYATKLGRDMSLLNIMEAAKASKLAIVEKAKNIPKDYRRAPDYMAVMHGYRVHPALLEWAEAITRPVTTGIYSDVLRVSKGFAFINPLFLSAYNTFQLAMQGVLTNVKMPKYMYRAFKNVRDKDSQYREAAMHGLQSSPTHEPWESFRPMMERAAMGSIPGQIGMMVKEAISPNVLKMAGKTLMDVYQASWNIAWKLDEFTRYISYQHGLDKGYTPRQAAQMAARFMGDYASVPAATRRFLNVPFFTPTYKITMGKLFYDMVKGAAKSVVGKGDSVDKAMALSLVRTAAILIGIDWAMGKAGFKSDRWGMSYSKEFTDETGKKQEVVLTGSVPLNLPLKYMYRTWAAFRGDKVNPQLTIFNSMLWEVHPIWRTVYNVMRNKDERGRQIVQPFDSAGRKGVDALVYATGNIVRALGSLNPEEDDAQANTQIQKELGWAAILIGLVPLWGDKAWSAVTYNYVRGTQRSRQAFAINRLVKEYQNQVFMYTRKQREEGRPLDMERLRKWAEDFHTRVERLKEMK